MKLAGLDWDQIETKLHELEELDKVEVIQAAKHTNKSVAHFNRLIQTIM